MRFLSVLLSAALVLCLLSFIGASPARAGEYDWAIPSGPLPEPPPVNDPKPDPGDTTGSSDDNDPLPEPTYVPDPTPSTQPTNQQPTPAPTVDPQQAFERQKEALLQEFHMPAVLADDAQNLPDAIPTATNEDSLGMGAAPAGVSDSDWKDAADCQQRLATIYSKWPLSNADAAEADKLDAQRNALWAKAIGSPELSSSDRQRLRMQIPIPNNQPDASLPTLATDTVKGWLKPPVPSSTDSDNKSAPTENPVASWLVGQFALGQLQSKIEAGGEEFAEDISEENSFGDFLGVGKIALAYKDGGASSAIAEAANYVVGKIPIPQSSIAVEGGRQYSNAVFQAENKFMTDAMKAAGGQFDKEKFWSDFNDDLNVYQKAVKEWVGFGTD